MEKNNALFGKSNLRWMLIGVVIIIMGLLLMIGGKNEDPNIFDTNEVYSKYRITIAPLLILLGLLVEVYGIMKRDQSE